METGQIITLMISSIGALAWLPQIITLLKRQRILGKIISRYDKQTFFLFKLSLFSKNKPFQLKNVSCVILFEDGQEFKDITRNMRRVIFNGDEELQVLGKDFINNFSFLPANENIEGYLFFSFSFSNRESSIKKTSFIFESYDKKRRALDFIEKEIDSKQMFFDDSIWEKVS